MCNRYRNEIRKAGRQLELFGFEEFSQTRIRQRLAGRRLTPAEDVFPDRPALVIRAGGGGPEPAIMRWGLPGPSKFGAAPVTNVRNLKSPHWRGVLGAGNRCVVPFTSFSEYEDASPKGRKVLRWFTPGGDAAFFAGLWRTWEGLRGTKAEQARDGAIAHDVFAFLTTEANDIVRPVHAKAMPVVLTSREEIEAWLAGADAEMVQAHALPDEALTLEPLAA
jgi:putative SOS response-associated peptidase YedK